VLADAARIAFARGAPDTAASYLRRALAEPAEPERRAELARSLGAASVRAGLPEAEDDLRHALQLAHDGESHAAVALDLARLRTLAGENAIDGVEELARCARERSDLSATAINRIHAEIVAIGDMDISVRPHAVAAASELPADPDPSDPAIAAMLLAHRATDAIMRCAPASEVAELARQALADGALVSAGLSGIQLSFLAAYFLMCADCYDDADRFFEQVIAEARRTGSAAGFASASAWHSFVAFRRGRLADAAAEARSAIDVAQASGLRLVNATALMNLCWALVDRDQAAEAAAHLSEAAFEPEDLSFFVGATTLDARGRVRIASDDLRGGVADLRESGRRIAACGLDNPACFPWRSGIAEALVALQRKDEALELARQEVALARQWAAPRALGIALHGLGTISPPDTALDCFAEAVDVLADSPARLQRARSLIDYGAALRRAGRRVDARPHLRTGLELAIECGAPLDVSRARSELRAAGSRARVADRSGFDALTPSEHRIAILAAQGRSNPEIAQDLFITRKTVEMHLSGAYRKLGIRSRNDLSQLLGQ
jgi:DNA-binding CsgD family transcriptional regulator